MNPWATPVRGLYLAGPSVHPGAGVHGVSGAAAARALINDRSPAGSGRRATAELARRLVTR